MGEMLRLHDEDDKLHEECGIFGVWAPGEDVARLTYFGLYALQHRGQESAGIASTDGHNLMSALTRSLSSSVLSTSRRKTRSLLVCLACIGLSLYTEVLLTAYCVLLHISQR